MNTTQAPKNLEQLLEKLPDSETIRNELIASRKQAKFLTKLLKIRVEAEECGETVATDEVRRALATASA